MVSTRPGATFLGTILLEAILYMVKEPKPLTPLQDAPSFDFVLDQTLRTSLESDFREMQIASLYGAWKACVVLGGSIVEALLLDYLVSEKVITNYSDASAKSFEDLITTSFKNNLISERVKEQAFLLKRYRNLIHQGKVLRLKEQCDSNSAMTTLALVNIVLEEIASKRRASYGLTAEQFCKKIIADPRNSTVLSHLLKGMHAREVERLLCEILPKAAFENEYIEIEYDPFSEDDQICHGNPDSFNAIIKAYRIVFEQAKPKEKQAALKEIARNIREEAGPVVLSMTMWFMQTRDLAYAEASDVELIVDYCLELIQDKFTFETLRLLRGITVYMEPKHTPKLLDRLAVVSSRDDVQAGFSEACWEMLRTECTEVKSDLVQPFSDRLKSLANWADTKGLRDHAERLRNLHVEYDPFV